MILMTVQNVSKSFGMNCVLKDISLTLQQGARMGLIGVNGSGTVSYTHLDVYKRQPLRCGNTRAASTNSMGHTGPQPTP